VDNGCVLSGQTPNPWWGLFGMWLCIPDPILPLAASSAAGLPCPVSSLPPSSIVAVIWSIAEYSVSALGRGKQTLISNDFLFFSFGFVDFQMFRWIFWISDLVFVVCRVFESTIC
jgi:hypothetical protein